MNAQSQRRERLARHFHFIKQNLWLFDIKRETYVFDKKKKVSVFNVLAFAAQNIPRNSFEFFPFHRNHCWRFMLVRKFSFRMKCLTATSHDHKKSASTWRKCWKFHFQSKNAFLSCMQIKLSLFYSGTLGRSLPSRKIIQLVRQTPNQMPMPVNEFSVSETRSEIRLELNGTEHYNLHKNVSIKSFCCSHREWEWKTNKFFVVGNLFLSKPKKLRNYHHHWIGVPSTEIYSTFVNKIKSFLLLTLNLSEFA